MRYLVISPAVIETRIHATKEDVIDDLSNLQKAENAIAPNHDYHLNVDWETVYEIDGVRYWIVEDGYNMTPTLKSDLILIIEVV